MKIFFVFLFIFNVLLLQAQFNNYEDGDTVNDFTVTDVNGVNHNLYSYTSQGKYIYMDFFYSICGGCQSFIPVFNEFYDKYGCNEGDVICIAMNSGFDKDADVIAFEEAYGGDFFHAPAVSSQGGCIDVVNDFDPKYYPAACLIGPDNTMINANISPIDSVENLEAVFPEDFNPSPMNCSLGIIDSSFKDNFKIYPNPNDGKTLYVDYVDKEMYTSISIVNMLGQKVYDTIIMESGKIDFNLEKGTYIITIQNTRVRKNVRLLIN